MEPKFRAMHFCFQHVTLILKNLSIKFCLLWIEPRCHKHLFKLIMKTLKAALKECTVLFIHLLFILWCGENSGKRICELLFCYLADADHFALVSATFLWKHSSRLIEVVHRIKIVFVGKKCRLMYNVKDAWK